MYFSRFRVNYHFFFEKHSFFFFIFAQKKCYKRTKKGIK